MSAIEPLSSNAVDESLEQIALVLDDGWTWTDETRSDMRQAAGGKIVPIR